MALARRRLEHRAMASPWRRRPLCLLVADGPVEVTIGQVSARGATVTTTAILPVGRTVELHHPQAGMIPARVVAQEEGALRLAFAPGALAVGYALAATFADMTGAG